MPKTLRVGNPSSPCSPETRNSTNLLLESHPLVGTPRLAKFREWLIGIARGPILVAVGPLVVPWTPPEGLL